MEGRKTQGEAIMTMKQPHAQRPQPHLSVGWTTFLVRDTRRLDLATAT